MTRPHLTAIFLSLSFISGPLLGADFESAMRGLRTRTESIRTIEIECNGTVVIPQGAFNRQLDLTFPDARKDEHFPPSDYAFPVRRQYLVDFSNGWWKAERSDQNLTFGDTLASVEFIQENHEIFFDGVTYWDVQPSELNRPISRQESRRGIDVETIGPGGRLPSVAGIELVPLLIAGRITSSPPPPTIDRLQTFSQHPPLTSRGNVTIQGQPCTLAVTAPLAASSPLFHEYCIDDHGRIWRWRQMAGQDPTRQLDLVYSADPKALIPTSYQFTSFLNQAVFRSESGTLSGTINPETTVTQFQYEASNGQLILSRRNGSESYSMHGSPEISKDLDYLVLAVQRRERARWLVVIGGCVTAIIVVVLGIQRFRARAV